MAMKVRGRKQPGKKTLRTSGESNRYTSNCGFQDDAEFDVDNDDEDDDDDNDDDNDEDNELVSTEWTKER
ncbi:hypothetical protein SAICODRAFT_28926 [Saitoella complicata NRRL Y-17804]|uniref:Uncharacterized protein n=1 Tax=Saitoella complicata (strain BCRC 22490 / CBS 7301 / JCM 7358 / NBRC 10748 / NRRL Y-17804) TaxID=698492 RepID=A0A0E9NB97_SAICN|nr:uncharacterized protein SAICODRAFT_28926 [Saitoella complicata NRRL Y-17804]ODQ55245.1 hypothetical protein SAICODRAFT_28926 [Saitoella complicata NRRL Y-17804]GAO47078.1 hypothetical protein G7K_1290-t1 [Saitoella complicata NRRL Y-17804]